MTRIHDLLVSELLPSSISYDKTIRAFADSLNEELQAITKAIDEILIMPNIEQLPEDVIDLLAWQFHVDFYEPLGLDLHKKRQLVKNALLWHQHKGTKSVLENMLSILFSPDCKIYEWFEYGGDPYFFRVFIDNVQLRQEDYGYILMAVWELKNVRSWLEKIIVHKDFPQTIYIGHTLTQKLFFTIPFEHPKNIFPDSNARFGLYPQMKTTYRIEMEV